ncbi:hypothetical protein D3C80_1748450 [compost metagenome]
MVVRPGQSGVLHHKFDIDDTTGILLDIEGHTGIEGVGRRPGGAELGAEVVAHLGAHLADLGLQLGQVARLAENACTHGLERRTHLRATDQHPGANQGLMLPGPGFVLLVTLKGAQRADQQT